MDSDVPNCSPVKAAYYYKCCALIALQCKIYGGEPQSVLTLPFPPANLEYDEGEVKLIFESFFRKRGWTVEVLFTSDTAH